MNKLLSFYLSFLSVIFSFNCLALSDGEIDRLLITYKNNLDALERPQAKYDFAFGHYPKDNLYKLFIDMERLKSRESCEQEAPAHLLFDVKEPGYYQAMTTAFKRLPEFIDQPLTLDLIIELHDMAISGVMPINGERLVSGLSIGRGGYGTNPKKFNLLAHKEIFYSGILYDQTLFFMALPAQKEHIPDPSLILKALRNSYGVISGNLLANPTRDEFLAWTNDYRGKIRGIYSNESELRLKLAPLLAHYEQSIGATSTLMGRLSAIGELLRALEVSHFFNDGNQRTYAFLLLTKLLIDNGIPPALLDDPYMFDGFMTVSGMAHAIRDGIINFLNEGSLQQDLLQSESVGLAPISWLSLSDYQPYFAQKFVFNKVQQMVEGKRASFEQVIKESIDRNEVNQMWNDIHPLSLAFLLDDAGLIEQLLQHGASLLGDKKLWFLQSTPYSLGMALYGPEFVANILEKMQHDRLYEAKIDFLAEAIIDVIEKTNSQPDLTSDLFLRVLLPVIATRESEASDDTKSQLREAIGGWVERGDDSAKTERILLLMKLGLIAKY